MNKFNSFSRYFISTLLAAVLLSSCYSNGSTDVPSDEITGEANFHVKVIDSCEYIFKYAGYNRGYVFAHKGNCKFCEARHSR